MSDGPLHQDLDIEGTMAWSGAPQNRWYVFTSTTNPRWSGDMIQMALDLRERTLPPVCTCNGYAVPSLCVLAWAPCLERLVMPDSTRFHAAVVDAESAVDPGPVMAQSSPAQRWPTHSGWEVPGCRHLAV